MADDSAVDRLTSLPDDLLLQILSFIPSTKLRAHTGLLSRRYRHIWTAVPTLEFPLHDFPNPTLYPAAVDRCLSLSSAPSLLRFRADAADFTTPSIHDFDRWIRFAASRSVSELALSLYPGYDPLPVFTPSLFLCSGCLSSLNLISCNIPVRPPNFEGFRSLKTLHLTDVPLSDEMALSMLAGCPLLERLSLNRCRGITRLEISPASNPHLGYLNLERMMRTMTETIVVDVPELRVFDFDGNIKKLQIREAPRLRAVQIISRFFQLHENYEQWIRLVSVFADVEVLSVSCWFFEFCITKNVNRPAWFTNLRELHWIGISITERNMKALVVCLPECPVLEKLIINLDYSLQLDKEVKELQDMDVDDYDGSVNEEYFISKDDRDVGLLVPCDPSECHMDYLPRLKMFTITQFLEDGISMILVEFILRKAVVLELLQLTLVPDEMLVESLRKLISGFYHASPNVKIDVSELSDVKGQCDYKIFQHLWSF